LIPEAGAWVTGGNVYNAEILARAPRGCEIRIRQLEGSERRSSGQGRASARAPRAVVVDSLLLGHSGLLPRLERDYPEVSWVLLVHSLDLMQEPPGPRAETERTALPWFRAFVVTSEFSASALVRDGIDRSRVRVVTPGLGPVFRQRFATRPACRSIPAILCVASRLPGKGLLELIELLGSLQEERWRCTIVGDSRLAPAHAAAEARAVAERGLGDRIRFLPPRPQPALLECYDEHDIFVLPSRFETYGMAVMEAIARGLPVLAFATGGLPECLARRAEAALVCAGDWDEFRRRLTWLIRAAAHERSVLGERNRLESERFPDWDRQSRAFFSALFGLGGGQG